MKRTLSDASSRCRRMIAGVLLSVAPVDSHAQIRHPSDNPTNPMCAIVRAAASAGGATEVLTPKAIVLRTRELGARYLLARTNIYCRTDVCDENEGFKGAIYPVQTALDHRLPLGFVVGVVNEPPSGKPSEFPASLDAYKAELRKVRDYLSAIAPLNFRTRSVIVIENEENVDLYYSSDPRKYLEQLAAALSVSRENDGRIPVTNGGMTRSSFGMLVWYHYFSSGRLEEAAEYARIVLRADKPKGADMRTIQWLNEAYEKGKVLIDGYTDETGARRPGYRDLGLDYFNLHWYKFAESTPEESAQAFDATVAYLHDVLPGVRLMVNEMGQKDGYSADTVHALLKAAVNPDNDIAYVCWFDHDSTASTPANALHYYGSPAPGPLRPNGHAYRRFNFTHYGRQATGEPIGNSPVERSITERNE